MNGELVSRLGIAIDRGYVYATRLDHESVRYTQQAKLNEVTSRFEKDLEANATRRLATAIDKDNAAMVAAETGQQHPRAVKVAHHQGGGAYRAGVVAWRCAGQRLTDLPLQYGDSVHISANREPLRCWGRVSSKLLYLSPTPR